MATTYNHAQIGIVDASGNINVIYPITTGADVSITRTNTKLPTAATTAQALANAFGKLAFADSEISDSETSTTKTWSSNKINTAITKLNSNCKKINTYVGNDGKIHFVNSGGADTVLNFSSGAKSIVLNMDNYGWSSTIRISCESYNTLKLVDIIEEKHYSENNGMYIKGITSTGSNTNLVGGRTGIGNLTYNQTLDISKYILINVIMGGGYIRGGQLVLS